MRASKKEKQSIIFYFIFPTKLSVFHGKSTECLDPLFFKGLWPSYILPHVSWQFVTAKGKPASPTKVKSLERKKRVPDGSKKQLAHRQLITSPESFNEYSGRLFQHYLSVHTLYVPISNIYCQISPNNRVLELDCDHSKVEGASKTGNMSLTVFLSQNLVACHRERRWGSWQLKKSSIVKELTGLIIISASEIFKMWYVKTCWPLGNKWGC